MLECFPSASWNTILLVCPCIRGTGTRSPCRGSGVVRGTKPVHTDGYRRSDTAPRSSDPSCRSHCAAWAKKPENDISRCCWGSHGGPRLGRRCGKAEAGLFPGAPAADAAVPGDVALLELVMAAVAALAGVAVAAAPSRGPAAPNI